MNPIIPEWPAPDCVKAFSTVRAGGFSMAPYHGNADGTGGLNLGLHVGDDPVTVRRNRALLKTWLPSEPVWLNQVHGSNIVDAGKVGGIPDADASFTFQKDTVCVVMTADCLPVLLCTADGTAVAAVHAGWRGLSAGVLEKAVGMLGEKGGSGIMAWLGPAIGPAAFEVGEDVRKVFLHKDRECSAAFRERRNAKGKYLADIYGLARDTLKKAGVSRVYGGNFCTVTDSGRFYSYRRDKVTGRMATGIWIASREDQLFFCNK
ncbi:peptidoglycan editing factor PgeF [Oxalobacter paraformigenes]|nr:peptidoglycan editing factor PgeF [Oxalobacter paraformigenes]